MDSNRHMEDIPDQQTPFHDAKDESTELGFDGWMEMIHCLPIHYRTVFMLRTAEGCKYEEIANKMGIKVGDVKNYMNRARNKLKLWHIQKTGVNPASKKKTKKLKALLYLILFRLGCMDRVFCQVFRNRVPKPIGASPETFQKPLLTVCVNRAIVLLN